MKRLAQFISPYWQLVVLFSALKLVVHLITNTNYELHRDAYLYYAQSEHLAWGFHSVPPFVAVIGKIATTIFGNSVFGIRFFPAIVGTANIVVIAFMIEELAGKKTALILACSAFLLSPVFLHVNTMFQPVAFNQFFWLLAAYFILRLVKRNEPKTWLYLGIVFALAFLNKYSIIFFIVAFIISLALSEYRKLFLSKYLLWAIGLGIVLISPNIYWQIQNNFPVLMHMKELGATQLVHVDIGSFFFDQFLMHVHAIWLLLTALVVLFFVKREKPYRIFAFIFLLVIGFMVWGRGKSYYTMGVYPILFVFGAYFIEKYLKKGIIPVSLLIISHMVISLVISFNFDGIPFRTAAQTYKEDTFTWEDGKKHALPQDMADMTGWKEMAESVVKVYSELSADEQKNCAIFCHHYGQAGAIMFYGKKKGLPQPACFNGSFTFWSPESITEQNVIVVVHEREDYSETEHDIDRFFDSWETKHVVNNKYFRENGTRIYHAKGPQKGFTEIYRQRREEAIRPYTK